MKASRHLVHTVALLVVALLSGCASVPADKAHPDDPFERVNRATYKFNSSLDRAVLKPVATAYRDYVPQFVRTGVSNFLDNLGYPSVIVNDLLQGKLVDGLKDTGRLVLNSTLGIGGLLDPASTVGLSKNDEDFGQTLGKWGVPAGPYLVLPLLGPSTLRDTPSRYVDSQLSIIELLEDDVELFDEDGFVAGIVVLNVLDTRAGLLNLDSVLGRAYDEYAFVRDSWLKRREFQVRDGDVPDEEPIEEFPMEEEDLPPDEAASGTTEPAATPPDAGETGAVPSEAEATDDAVPAEESDNPEGEQQPPPD